MAGIASARTSAVARPGCSMVANQMPSRSTSWSWVEAGLAQEAFERLRRRGGARALQLLARPPRSASGRPRAMSARRRGVA